jgi:predicted AlkP superfamily phosphohydrolase/phosphomutase
MVAGEPCPDTETGLAYPEDFADTLSDRFAFHSTFWSKPNDEIIAGLKDMDERRIGLARQLIDEKDLDAMVVVLGATDRVQHNFWRYYDPSFAAKLGLPSEANYEEVIPDTYRRADAVIGQLLSHIGEDTTVFIISDHGGGPATTQYLHTNAWLRQQGLLSVKQGQDTVLSSLRRVVMAARRGVGAKVEYRLRGLLPNRFIEQGRSLVRNVAQIDWLNTQAYRFPMYPPAEGIEINVVGRQQQGTVHPGDEYEQVRGEILEQAHKLIDPDTGKPVVVHSYKREELYHGPHIERAPDIVLILSDDYRGGINLLPPIISSVDPSSLTKVNGEHRTHGVLLVRGPMINQNLWVEQSRLVDMAPTILYTLGVPVPDEMDGVVLEDLFLTSFRKTHPVMYSDQGGVSEIGIEDSGLTPEEEDQLRKHLERLGYI